MKCVCSIYFFIYLFFFFLILQIWYIVAPISWSIWDSPLAFEITRVDCICSTSPQFITGHPWNSFLRYNIRTRRSTIKHNNWNSLPLFCASFAVFIVSAGLLLTPSVITIPTQGTFFRPFLWNSSIIVWIPKSVRVPSRGCFNVLAASIRLGLS